jgi:hypothetical protein
VTGPADARIFSGLFPVIGPWTNAALWSGLYEVAVPTTPIEAELGPIAQQRLTPLLLRYLRRHVPDMVEQLPGEVSRHAFDLTAVSSLVVVKGSEVSTTLQAAGIPNVAVKGPTIAATYPSWQDRPFADLDLYVSVDQFREAVALCQSRGMVEDDVNRQPRQWIDWTCREALNLVGGSGVSIDLHHHVPPWFWGRDLRGTDLISRGKPFEMLGHTLTGAPPEDNLLIAALHVVSDKNAPGATLMIWRDLAQLSLTVDVDVVVRRASDVGLAGWLLGVLQQLPAKVQPSDLVRALRTVPLRLRGRRRLELVLSDRLSPAGVVATQSLRLPAWRAAAFTAGMLFPSRDFLDKSLPDARYRRIEWWTHVGRR